ncbi:hypothetical protein [Streptomyces sp. WMMC905]|nr:hypothetical protein [Streptomyces sp. HSG2]
MGWTVLYIAFGVVALWLLGEVLLQYKARLRWRLLAFGGFVGVVLGVLMPSVVVIGLGAAAFAVGQTYVTLSFRQGFVAGWSVSTPGKGRGRAERGRREPTLEVSGIEVAGEAAGTSSEDDDHIHREDPRAAPEAHRVHPDHSSAYGSTDEDASYERHPDHDDTPYALHAGQGEPAYAYPDHDAGYGRTDHDAEYGRTDHDAEYGRTDHGGASYQAPIDHDAPYGLPGAGETPYAYVDHDPDDVFTPSRPPLPSGETTSIGPWYGDIDAATGGEDGYSLAGPREASYEPPYHAYAPQGHHGEPDHPSYPPYADPYAGSPSSDDAYAAYGPDGQDHGYQVETPPGGVWMPQQRGAADPYGGESQDEQPYPFQSDGQTPWVDERHRF